MLNGDMAPKKFYEKPILEDQNCYNYDYITKIKEENLRSKYLYLY